MRLDCTYTDQPGNNVGGSTVRCESITLLSETASDREMLTRLARMLHGGGTAARQLLLLLQRGEDAQRPSSETTTQRIEEGK
jgi:hypothetical protein